MKFTRRPLTGFDIQVLRAAGARHGYLLEDADSFRVGLGGVAIAIDLPRGLVDLPNQADFFAGHVIEGVKGPAGTGIVAFGTLPFERAARSSLHVPHIVVSHFPHLGTWITTSEVAPPLEDIIADLELPSQETQVAVSMAYQPSGDEYAHSVAVAVEDLRSQRLTKVVLARSVQGTVDWPIDPAAVAHRLHRREPQCTIYATPLPDGRRFVGASPELLVSRTDNTALCHPLAGTIALPPDVRPHDYQAWLLGSAKNLHEHHIVANEVAAALAPYFDSVDADEHPSIVALRTVAHLGTWIRGTSSKQAPTALELVAALHPTAAVGGLPRLDAAALIAQLETRDRGHYAGPVGWIDAEGDGAWWIGIRGVMISGASFEAWAGAGIVSESDPIAEREETRNKLASCLAAVLVDRI